MNPAMTDRAALPVHSTKSSVTGQETTCRAWRRRRTAADVLAGSPVSYLMWTPEMARLITSRWISDVPSKIV